ncbi:MAG: recombinase family protein [Oscillospiraceae bacterium]|nr:recombinase family protein [Oscillospiraceae bacterium]
MKNTRLPDNSHYSAALYMRLSKDDDGAAESVSITTQRKMLRAYALENHYAVYGEYIDDGVSGTTFERPDFKRMISDIEEKKINMIITKDLSRLGRDYILAGQYTEIYFPSKRVRYIAINDGYDSDSPYTDIVPFKNVINEMYARDTSKKIRSAFTTRMQEGAFIGAFAPYGYKRDSEDKHHLIIDDVVVKIVKEIFQSAADGILPIQIARELNRRNVLIPIEYRCEQNPNMNVENYSKRREWTSSTITKMLQNVAYLGHMAQGKTTKVSFKSDLTIANPKLDWFVVENTHEPIVSHEVFDLAYRRSQQRTCMKKGQFSNLFSGIAKCADCGRNMSTVGTRKKGATANLACGGYKLYGSKECSNHFIDYDTLYEIVLSSIRELVQLSEQDETGVLDAVQIQVKKQNTQSNKINEITSLKKRSRELDALIEKLYEDNVQGLLSTERMNKMLQKYEAESREIAEQLEQKEKENKLIETVSPMDKLKKLLDGYINPTELSSELLYRLIDHIEIGQGTYQKSEHGKVKNQTVKFFFRFAGTPITKKYTS